jgi:hypothetical protein
MTTLPYSQKLRLEASYGPLVYWPGYREDREVVAGEECRHCGHSGLEYVALRQDHQRTHTVETRTGRYVAAFVCPGCGDVGVF